MYLFVLPSILQILGASLDHGTSKLPAIKRLLSPLVREQKLQRELSPRERLEEPGGKVKGCTCHVRETRLYLISQQRIHPGETPWLLSPAAVCNDLMF